MCSCRLQCNAINVASSGTDTDLLFLFATVSTQEAQQRYRAILRVIEYFARLLKKS